MLGDTIWAVASATGGARGVLRVSGTQAFDAVRRVSARALPRARATCEAEAEVLGRRVPCLVLVMPGPRSFTGEDVVELHLPGAALLLETVGTALGVRRARTGEFMRRAHRNGRLALDEA